MSRRTFPRAVAAGLIVAALGGPAAGQAPNPWRGECAALPTAPAPRAVAAKPTRQLTIGVGFSTAGGLTATVEVRELPVAKPAQVESVPLTLPSPRYLQHVPRYFPPDPSFPMPVELRGVIDPDAPVAVVPASYATAPAYMPPPAPLPVPRIPPAAP